MWYARDATSRLPSHSRPRQITPRDEIEIGSQSRFHGATVANLSPALADELGIDPQVQGVVIVRVAEGLTGAIGRFSEGRHRGLDQ